MEAAFASAVQHCLSTAPSWTVEILGPVPIGDTDPLEVVITCIICRTREEAEANAWEKVHELCELSSYAFAEDDWELIDLRIVNGN